jgi:hypothetical protein
MPVESIGSSIVLDWSIGSLVGSVAGSGDGVGLLLLIRSPGAVIGLGPVLVGLDGDSAAGVVGELIERIQSDVGELGRAGRARGGGGLAGGLVAGDAAGDDALAALRAGALPGDPAFGCGFVDRVTVAALPADRNACHFPVSPTVS